MSFARPAGRGSAWSALLATVETEKTGAFQPILLLRFNAQAKGLATVDDAKRFWRAPVNPCPKQRRTFWQWLPGKVRRSVTMVFVIPRVRYSAVATRRRDGVCGVEMERSVRHTRRAMHAMAQAVLLYPKWQCKVA